MKWVNVFLPVVTLILGYAGTLLTESRRDARQVAAAAKAKANERQTERADERRTFELDILRQVHTRLSDHGRSVAQAHHADVMTAKQFGSYASHQLPEGISDQIFQTNRALIDIEVLILDDDIRMAVNRARKGLATPGLLKNATVENAEELFVAAIQDLATAQDLIGARIRALYDEAVTTS